MNIKSYFEKRWEIALRLANKPLPPGKEEDVARAFMAMSFFVFSGYGAALSLLRQKRTREAEDLLRHVVAETLGKMGQRLGMPLPPEILPGPVEQ